MSILDLTDMGDREKVEFKPMEAGTEAELIIIDCRSGVDKNGNSYILPTFEVVNEPYCPEFTKFIGLPNKDMSDKKHAQVKNRVIDFEECFGVEILGRKFDTEEARGQRGWCILGVEEDPEYGDKNYIKKYVRGV